MVRLGAIALVASSALSCGVPRDDRPRPIADDRVPFDLLDPRPVTTTTTMPVTTTTPTTATSG